MFVRPDLNAQGVIIRGLRRSAIQTTMMSQSLGFEWEEPFNKDKHPDAVSHPAIIMTSPYDGAKVVQNRIQWLYKKVCLSQE